MPQASRSHDFLESLAVNTHMLYGGAYSVPANVLSALQYLGFHHVRDWATTGSFTSAFSSLGAAGIKLNTGYGSNDSDYGAQSSTATQQVLANAAYIASIEGPNEVNFSTPNPSNGLSTPQQIQAYIKTMINANPSLSAAKSVCFSVASASLSTFQSYGDNSANCDFANAHIYFGGGIQPYQSLHDFGSPLTAGDCPNRPVFVTETGYTTATIQGGGNQAVSQNVAARETLNMYMDCWLLGYIRTFKYELFDEGTDGQQESSYGFFYNDRSAKPVATAMHNLTTIMADAGATAATFTPGSLAYTLTGQPGTGHNQLFQRSDGTWLISVWAEPSIWNQSTMTDITPSTVTVTANLGATYPTVQVFDPMVGTAAQQTLTNVSSVALGITDHPLLVAVTPAAAAAHSRRSSTLIRRRMAFAGR